MTPAVGITVSKTGGMEQVAMGLESFHDRVIGGQHRLAGEQGRSRQEFAVRPYRIVYRQAVAGTDDIVFLAMGRRRVDGARAGLGSDVIGQDDRHFPVVKGMFEYNPFQFLALAVSDDLVVCHIPAG
jgi:hypothetical protein